MVRRSRGYLMGRSHFTATCPRFAHLSVADRVSALDWACERGVLVRFMASSCTSSGMTRSWVYKLGPGVSQ
jgi:hypothetical protein